MKTLLHADDGHHSFLVAIDFPAELHKACSRLLTQPESALCARRCTEA